MAEKIEKITGKALVGIHLIVFRPTDGSSPLAIESIDKVGVTKTVETTDGKTLINKARFDAPLYAQLRAVETITGVDMTYKDLLFTPRLLHLINGGTLSMDGDDLVSYVAPVVGSSSDLKYFDTEIYQYLASTEGYVAGKYMKLTYYNCLGDPIVPGADEDFLASEYTISSAPATGQSLYRIDLVDELPTLLSESEMSNIHTITFNAGAGEVTPTSAQTDDTAMLDSLPTPVLIGYTFEGWYREPTFVNLVDVSTVYSDSITIYAKYEEIV